MDACKVYWPAFGDQPALICDVVDRARAFGIVVVAVCHRQEWLWHFCASTPQMFRGGYGLTPEQAMWGGLDGYQSAIECERARRTVQNLVLSAGSC